MKKLFSLLFVALLTLSAGAATYSFTFESSPKFSADGGTYTYDDVTWTYPSSPYISYEGGATSRGVQIGSSKNPAESFTFSTSDIEGTITKITVKASSTSSDADLRVTVGNSAFGGIQSIAGANNQDFTFEGSAEGEIVVTWTNNAIEKAMYFKSITVEYEDGDTPPAPAVAAPVFDPNGGEFNVNSLAVTVSCPTENASIYLFKVLEDETEQYVNQFFPQNGVVSGEFYVTETSKYGAYAYKGSDYSETTYVTFTKVNPKVATPTFNPASGTEFEDELDVTISCATPGATIMYEYGDVIDEAVAPVTITLTDNATITAIASLEGYDDSETATATYTKKDAPVYEPWEGTEVYRGTEDKGNYVSQSADQVSAMDNIVITKATRPGVSFTISNGAVGDEYRIYKGKTITFDSQVGDITKIEFYCTAEGDAKYGPANLHIANENGTYVYVGKVGTWAGKAANVTFTAVENQVRADSIIITIGGETPVIVAAPTFDPASGTTFEESIDVTMNAAEGATIYYTINGGDEQEGLAPVTITLTETSTIEAYAKLDGTESAKVTATYTKDEGITRLAQVNGLGNGTDFEFNGDAVVTAQHGQYLWLRDASGYGLIYGTYNAGTDSVNKAFAPGTVLSKGWTAKKTVYKGLTEYTNAKNVSASGVTDAEMAAIQEITELSDSLVNAYVHISDVTITAGSSNNNYTATFANGTTMNLYNQFGVNMPSEGTWSIKGAVGKYNSNLQLYVLEVEGYNVAIEVMNIDEASRLDNNSQFTYNGEAVVTYQNGDYTYIKDGSGCGLIYGTVDEFAQGTVLKDGWKATKVTFNGAPEFKNPEGVVASEDVVTVEPSEYTTVTSDNVYEYIIMKGQTLTAVENDTTGRNYINADSLSFYNKFDIVMPTFEEGKTYDVVGIVNSYYGKAEVYMISVTEVAAQQWALGDVNHDTFVNVADVTALIKYILTSGDEPAEFYTEQANVDGDEAGVLNVADVTALIQLILNQ